MTPVGNFVMQDETVVLLHGAVPSPLQYGWLRKYWKRALVEVEADSDLRLHDLRHCCAQWAVEEGVPEAKIQAQLRHTNPAMTSATPPKETVARSPTLLPSTFREAPECGRWMTVQKPGVPTACPTVGSRANTKRRPRLWGDRRSAGFSLIAEEGLEPPTRGL